MNINTHSTNAPLGPLLPVLRSVPLLALLLGGCAHQPYPPLPEDVAAQTQSTYAAPMSGAVAGTAAGSPRLRRQRDRQPSRDPAPAQMSPRPRGARRNWRRYRRRSSRRRRTRNRCRQRKSASSTCCWARRPSITTRTINSSGPARSHPARRSIRRRGGTSASRPRTSTSALAAIRTISIGRRPCPALQFSGLLGAEGYVPMSRLARVRALAL